jgi:hypothetical protein
MLDVEKRDRLHTAAVHAMKNIAQSALLGKGEGRRNQVADTPTRNTKEL